MAVHVEERARQSQGISSVAIYVAVAKLLGKARPSGGVLLDVGCGVGRLCPFIKGQFSVYHGCDVTRYDQFPDSATFTLADFDGGQIPLPDRTADAVVAVETIEHLENPRAFMREMARLVKPNGIVIVTTPNQLSLLSKLTLVIRNQFNAFQDSCYPAHITALLESDLRRISQEVGLIDAQIWYSEDGRIPGTGRHYPRLISRIAPRAMSDSVILMASSPS